MSLSGQVTVHREIIKTPAYLVTHYIGVGGARRWRARFKGIQRNLVKLKKGFSIGQDLKSDRIFAKAIFLDEVNFRVESPLPKIHLTAGSTR